MGKRQTRKKENEENDEVILQRFEENFLRLKFESGHALAPDLKEAAKNQVLLYWRRLKEVAESITETEVRLNLPGEKTPSKRKFNIEGVVDIVSGGGRTVMYDLKTHDPEYVRQNKIEYEKQLNVYAHIWRNLRHKELNETAIIATQFPDSLDKAWKNRDRDPVTLEEELRKWDPVILIPFHTGQVKDTIREFGEVVDKIEEGKYKPPPLRTLKKREVKNRTFATRVCRNCDIRFSCSSYREYVKTSKSRDLPRFREIYEDTGTRADQQSRMDAGLDAALPGGGATETV